MDTMTFTKIGGAVCGSLLVFLLLNWAAESIFFSEGGGHGEGAEAAYVIEVEGEEEGHGNDAADQGSSMAAMVAAADVEKGAKVYSKCKACHKLEDGKNATGPFLFNILNRDIAAVEGYGYSDALAALDGDWTIEALDGFLTKPKTYVPGTKMGFAGLKKEGDRANLIAYLATFAN